MESMIRIRLVVGERFVDACRRGCIVAYESFVVVLFLGHDAEVHPCGAANGVVGFIILEVGAVVEACHAHVEAFHIEEILSFAPELDTFLEDDSSTTAASPETVAL